MILQIVSVPPYPSQAQPHHRSHRQRKLFKNHLKSWLQFLSPWLQSLDRQSQRPGIQPVAILPQATHQMVAMQPMVAVAPQPPMHPPPMVEEPTAKRPRTEGQLIPEEEFFATYGRVRLSNYLFDFDFRFLFQGQVTITVQLPIVPEKPEWNLNGQAIPLTLPITDPVRI